jgi:hypothetical protein
MNSMCYRYLSSVRSIAVCCFGSVGLALASLYCPNASAETDLYTTKVVPLLQEKCVACHGPVKSEAGLRLDAAKLILQGATSGLIVDSNSPENSILLQRVAANSEERMPPSDSGVALKNEEIDLLRQWIVAGMPAPEHEEFIASPADHWSFRPLGSRRLEEVSSTPSNPILAIDQLLANVHAAKNLEPLPPTDKYTLLRRLTLDLTGLPPTIEEIQSFLADESPDAYEKRVDQLLDRPSYGERWARHWMDVWRYSDWDGYKEEVRGSQRNIWHWRDWIVESLNNNKSYKQMVLEMLAADELYPLDPNALRATGFLARNYHRSNRNIWLDATVEHTSKALLGLTVQCAKCHDHKYDPISQVDYYRYRALFEPHHVRTEKAPSDATPPAPPIPRIYDSDLNVATYLFYRGDDKHPAKDTPITPGVPSSLPVPCELSIDTVSLPIDAIMPELIPKNERLAIDAAWKKCNNALDQLNAAFAKKKSAERNEVTSNIDFDLAFELAKFREAQTALESLQSRYAADKAKHLADDESLAQTKSKAAIEAEERWMEANAELQWRNAQRAVIAAEKSNVEDETRKKAAYDKAKKELEKTTETYHKWRKLDDTVRLKNYTSLVKGYPKQSTGRRSALAHWIVDPANPLTARVAVNHIWARHFGAPLAANTFDFGLKSPKPELLELLDYLANRLLESDWDMKSLHREIVTSHAYRRASSDDETRTASWKAIDPDNKYCWRFNPLRLEAEAVRDSVLASSRLMDNKMGGPDISQDSGETVYRRSLYFRTAYEKQMTMMVLFDSANPSECYIRRPSIVPQQALVLANSTLCRVASRTLADRLWKETKQDSREFTRLLFLSTLNRPPSEAEYESCSEYLSQSSLGSPHQSLAHVLMNHNDFVTVR